MISKKVLGIISNLVAVILSVPLCLYFSFLGLMFLTFTGPIISIPRFFSLAAGGIWLCTPIFCIVGLILSVVFRKKDKYKYSYIVQLLPFFTVLTACFFVIISTIFGNT